jgi:dihydrofolate synthase/folylpolyglutamate synthase
MIERILRARGVHTGLFTSPHLIDFAERIRIAGRTADPDVLGCVLARVEAVPAPADAPRTFFEASFGMAALAFAEAGVGLAVVEAGLGGRLDATNVLAPVVTVITPIGLDHREVLGDTIEAIAAEKAGILKPAVPAVIAPQEPAALAVLSATAAAAGAPWVDAAARARVAAVHALDERGSDVTFEVEGRPALRTRVVLVGRHQVENAATALAAVAALDDAGPAGPREAAWGASAAEGLARVRWPGRFEACPGEPRLWWDGAHNAAGAAVARAAWRDALGDPPGVLVLGLAEDKDVVSMLEALAGPWRRVVTVAAVSPRARAPEALAALVRETWPGVAVTASGSAADGVRTALAALAPGERVLVAGSLFVVGEAMVATGTADLSCL